jgi:molecular chaperone DnaJ
LAADFYSTLGVGRDADQADIKQAYRALARKYHPDRNPGDAEAEGRFKDAAEAYRVLGDVDLRKQYDAYLAGGTGGASPAAASETAEDVFEEIFGTRPPPQARRRAPEPAAAPPPAREPQRARPRSTPAAAPMPERGSDLRYRLEVTLEEVALGARKQLYVPRKARCRSCGGTGARQGSAPVLCGPCRGTGSVRVQQGFFEQTQRCPECGGAGRVNPHDCRDCGGTGTAEQEQAVRVDVPPGVVTGTRLRVQGEGQGGVGGAPSGDLYVVVEVLPHPLFEREDEDLVTEVPVSFAQAALGAQVEVATLEGVVRMRIPAGSQSGRVFRLKGKGFPSADGRRRGDQRVRVVVETPVELSADEQQLYEELAELEAQRPPGEKLAAYLQRLHDYYG